MLSVFFLQNEPTNLQVLGFQLKMQIQQMSSTKRCRSVTLVCGLAAKNYHKNVIVNNSISFYIHPIKHNIAESLELSNQEKQITNFKDCTHQLSNYTYEDLKFLNNKNEKEGKMSY